MRLSRLLAVAVAALASLAVTPAPAAEFKGDAYPLDVCVVSGEKLGKDAVTVVLADMKDATLNGTEMKFCCEKCVAAFKADPEKFRSKYEELVVKASAAYPLATCLLMPDEKLDDDAKTVVYHNRVYKFCCKKCVNRFSRDPAKVEKDYEAAVIAAQKASYKATTCPISGKPLGEGAVDVVVGARLVRVCCPGCVGAVKADPKAAIAKIDAAK
ncbi:MAG: hypothetical protein ACKO0W_05445 [Planctomycetota bacterium]